MKRARGSDGGAAASPLAGLQRALEVLGPQAAASGLDAEEGEEVKLALPGTQLFAARGASLGTGTLFITTQ